MHPKKPEQKKSTNKNKTSPNLLLPEIISGIIVSTRRAATPSWEQQLLGLWWSTLVWMPGSLTDPLVQNLAITFRHNSNRPSQLEDGDMLNVWSRDYGTSRPLRSLLISTLAAPSHFPRMVFSVTVGEHWEVKPYTFEAKALAHLILERFGLQGTLKVMSFQLPCQGQGHFYNTRLLRAPASLVLNTARES